MTEVFVDYTLCNGGREKNLLSQYMCWISFKGAQRLFCANMAVPLECVERRWAKEQLDLADLQRFRLRPACGDPDRHGSKTYALPLN